MTESELIKDFDGESILIALSKGATLTSDEIESIKLYLEFSKKLPKNKRSLEEIYLVLTVLNKANDAELHYLVEQFLDFQDPLIGSFSLEILVKKWKIYQDLHERLIKFALGMPWDREQDLREVTLECIKFIIEDQTENFNEEILLRYKSLTAEILKDQSITEDIRQLALEMKSLF